MSTKKVKFNSMIEVFPVVDYDLSTNDQLYLHHVYYVDTGSNSCSLEFEGLPYKANDDNIRLDYDHERDSILGRSGELIISDGKVSQVLIDKEAQ